MCRLKLFQQISLILSLFLISGCDVLQPPPALPTATATLIPGIEEVIIIEDVRVLITSAHRRLTHVGDWAQLITSDVVLVIRAELYSSDGSKINLNDFKDWKVFVTDENGQEYFPRITSELTGFVDGKEGTFAEWTFAVDTKSPSFTVHLPGDQAVNLDPLINKDLSYE